MLLLVVLFVATLMALFGILGFLRVARGTFLTLMTLLGAVLFLRFVGAQMVGGFNKAWGMMQGGNGASLINQQSPGGFYLFVFFTAVVIGLSLGSLKPFRQQGKFSVTGLLLGLINGYTVATYALAVLLPEYAFLPVLIQVPGMTPTTPAPVPSSGSPSQLSSEILRFLNNLASAPALPIIIAGAIVVFIGLASRLSGKKG